MVSLNESKEIPTMYPNPNNNFSYLNESLWYIFFNPPQSDSSPLGEPFFSCFAPKKDRRRQHRQAEKKLHSNITANLLKVLSDVFWRQFLNIGALFSMLLASGSCSFPTNINFTIYVDFHLRKQATLSE